MGSIATQENLLAFAIVSTSASQKSPGEGGVPKFHNCHCSCTGIVTEVRFLIMLLQCQEMGILFVF